MLTFTVTEADTAVALGSGDVPVLATPRLLAWCEAATVSALKLPAGRTSVGTRVSLEHLLATPVGASVTVSTSVLHTDGRLVRFSVVAHDSADSADSAGNSVAGGELRLVGTAEVTRVVVDRARFLARLP